MDTCVGCRSKYNSNLELDECPKCGSGLVMSDDDNFVDFLSEYNSDGF